MIDNRSVVPYNSYLTRRYRAHINVEVCSSLKVVKYLYKYIFKGTDRTRRYLSPPESAWHIYCSHKEFSPVRRLPCTSPTNSPSTSTRTPPLMTSAIGTQRENSCI